MQISCERCGTLYVLDDKLIPASGAPVQCTRCGLVFTAKPPAGSVAAAPAPKPTAPPASARPSSTQMFGAVAPPHPTATPRPASSTQMFGAVGAPPPASSPAPSSTQMFGAVGAPPPASSPAPSSTQMFGAVAAPARQASSTQMFGAVGAQPPAAPEPSPSSTLVYGTPAQTAPAPAGAGPVFGGAASPGAPRYGAGSPAQTQMMGAVSAPAAADPRPASTTQMFGAVPAPAQPAKAPSSTQMFGAVAPVEPPRAASTTQMFGAVAAPAQPAKSPSSTQMFGAVAPVEPPKAASSTQMFGAVAPVEPPKAASSTQMFGAVAPVEPPKAASSTQMFGAVAPVEPPKSASSTQMFGAVAPVEPPKSASSTQMFGAVAPVEPPKSPSATQQFGAVAASAPHRPPSGTQQFGAVGGNENATLIDPAFAQPGSHKTEPMFRATPAPMPAHGGTRPMFPASDSPAAKTEANLEVVPQPLAPAPEPRPDQTLDLAPNPPAPGWATQAPHRDGEGAPAAAPRATPAPVQAQRFQTNNAAMQAAAGRPQRPSTLPGLPVGSETQELQLALQKSRSKTPIIAIAAVVALAAVGGGYRWWSTRPPPLDPAVAQAESAALDLIRKDDRASLEKAIADLEALEKTAPNFVPAKADQIIANILLMKDRRDELTRLESRYAQLDRERRKIEEKKETQDWVARANAKIDEMKSLKASMDPMVEEAKKFDDRAGEVLKAAKAMSEGEAPVIGSPAVLRAAAMYYAMKNNESAIRLADSYRRTEDPRGVLSDEQRAFADLAVAAFWSQPPFSGDKRDKALASINEALKKDSRLLRARVFEARVELGNKNFEQAREEIVQILAVSPKHEVALALKEEVDRAVEAAAKAKQAPEAQK